MADYSEDYLLDKRVKIFQPREGYRASTDAVLLAATVAKVKNGDSILDIGSGTGAVALCIAEQFKNSDIKICGVELQTELAALANMSAQANGFTAVKFFNENIFKTTMPFCSFDHVVSNPPYAEHDMPSPKTGKATAHNFGAHGLADWIAMMIKMIKPQGYFYMVNRAEALAPILSAIHGKLGAIEVFPIYSKQGQNAKRIIIRARKDSKAPLTVHPGLIVHQDSGEYSSAANAILREGRLWE